MTDMRRVLAENRRMVWLIAGAIVLNLVLLVLVVYPLSQKEQGGEAEARAASNELTIARADFANAKATVSGKGQADEELKKFYSEVLPSDVSGARRILYPHLDQLARKADLTTVSYRIAAEPGRQATDLEKLTMTMSLSGQYTNIRRFVHELETAAEFLVLESVSLSQGAEEGQALNVTAVVATYYRAGDGY